MLKRGEEEDQLQENILEEEVNMKPKAQLNSLIALSKSEGWQTVNEVMKDEILTLALLMARTKEMSSQEIDFNRGAIWAAEQMLNLPSRLIHKIEGDLALEEVTGPPRPPN
jgi:hypothetical protein